MDGRSAQPSFEARARARVCMEIKLLATDDEASALASTEMLHD
jgi:hypothetical protein